MIEVETIHNCDDASCNYEAEECYCTDHLEAIKQKSYEEGYQAAKAEFNEVK